MLTVLIYLLSKSVQVTLSCCTQSPFCCLSPPGLAKGCFWFHPCAVQHSLRTRIGSGCEPNVVFVLSTAIIPVLWEPSLGNREQVRVLPCLLPKPVCGGDKEQYLRIFLQMGKRKHELSLPRVLVGQVLLSLHLLKPFLFFFGGGDNPKIK